MNKKFVQIGAGRMGMSHIDAARQLDIELIAICDANADNLARASQMTGVNNCYATSEELFSQHKNLDLVLIATTADSHRHLVEQAAKSGAQAILCEKPMATSVFDARAMIEACRASGTRLAINHQMRFMDQYSLVKAELDSGRFGSLSSMNVLAGCFGLSMNGSHYCEAFRWLTGSDIVSASAWFSSEIISNPRGPDFYDRAGEVRFESEDGRRLMMSIGSDQGHGMTVAYGTQIGHILVDELEGVYTATARKEEHKALPATRYGMPWDRWERRFPQADNIGPTKAVIDALVQGVDYPDGDAGIGAVAALAAAWRSAENGSKPVRVDDLGEHMQTRFPWA